LTCASQEWKWEPFFGHCSLREIDGYELNLQPQDGRNRRRRNVEEREFWISPTISVNIDVKVLKVTRGSRKNNVSISLRERPFKKTAHAQSCPLTMCTLDKHTFR
jgi:hypothetical protein